MSDLQTLAAYDHDPASFAAEWNAQPSPDDMYDLLRKFFTPGETADIGCGSGRDTAWLAHNGFAPVGYDASEGLLGEARRAQPDIPFIAATLPELAAIGERRFVNVLCETVIMHLSTDVIPAAVARMVEILEPDGTLYLSWRVTDGDHRRDEHGRLYGAFGDAVVTDGLSGASVLVDATVTTASSGNVIRRVIARKSTDGRPGSTSAPEK